MSARRRGDGRGPLASREAGCTPGFKQPRVLSGTYTSTFLLRVGGSRAKYRQETQDTWVDISRIVNSILTLLVPLPSPSPLSPSHSPKIPPSPSPPLLSPCSPLCRHTQQSHICKSCAPSGKRNEMRDCETCIKMSCPECRDVCQDPDCQVCCHSAFALFLDGEEVGRGAVPSGGLVSRRSCVYFVDHAGWQTHHCWCAYFVQPHTLLCCVWRWVNLPGTPRRLVSPQAPQRRSFRANKASSGT